MNLENLYEMILKDEDKKAAYMKAVSEGKLAEFLKEQGCEAAPEEVGPFLKEKRAKIGELADEDLDNVAGGCDNGRADAPPCIYYDCGSVKTHYEEGKVVCEVCGRRY